MSTYAGTRAAHRPLDSYDDPRHRYNVLQGLVPDLSTGLCVTLDVDPDEFHPAGTDSAKYRQQAARVADTYCRPCPVREACRRWGLEHERTGIWGGVWLDRGTS